ncbi:uncharacterized protein LOC128634541 [Ictalurus punctatus]|uniref:ribonuclease H n=1 Tax=Ictalurus punctatus TaxID=7998 RepID=A0A9F7RPT4_ICTPU|nr:uncharacterized protein LOC128634541 [Ictalurus punctatus]
MRTETPAASMPLPDATSEIRRLLPPLGPEEDLEAYFETFESIARWEGWYCDDWPRALGARPRCQMNALIRITKRWLRPDRHTASEVAEKVAIDRFLRALPRAERQAMGAHAPTTPQELLTALERTLATLELDSGEQQHLDRPLGAQGPRSDRQTQPASGGTPRGRPLLRSRSGAKPAPGPSRSESSPNSLCPSSWDETGQDSGWYREPSPGDHGGGGRGSQPGRPTWPRTTERPPQKVKHLWMSVYHPQSDGFVERFNQTLKRMLRRASTGFTPFELLFGRRPRGLLDVAREAWEEQPSPFHSVVEYMQDMQARIDRRRGQVNYRLQQPGRPKDEKLYHVNLLKKWVEPTPVVSPFTAQDSDRGKGYWQVALAPEARPKTAFSTATGHWQYRVLPFGLHWEPATFQRLMDILLRPHRQFAAAYLDDVVIHSSTWADHLFHLREVLKALREAGLTANQKKCHLGLMEAQYLGYRIGRGMLKPQQKKIEAVKDYPRPTSKKQVRAFLGLAGYYRRFVPNFSAVASPLSDLTKKGQPDQVRWTADAERAFQALKEALTSAPILRNPDFDLPFTVHTDASETGLGAVLSQTFNGEEHPVLYISRKLSPAERKYAAVEREALAIKWAIEELRYYLAGRHFVLITDHAPLQWMAKAKDTNARVTRWFLALQDFSFQVKHRAGAQHGNADGLSRRDALWAHHRAAVGSELRGGYCRDGQRAGAHKRENAPSPTAAPARRGQLPAEHSASGKDRRGRAGLTRLRPAIGGSNGEVPPLRRWRRRIKGRASGREAEENIVASRRTPRYKRGRDHRIVRVAHTEDAGPGKPPPRLGNPASATSRLRRPSRLHKTPHSSTYNPFTSP